MFLKGAFSFLFSFLLANTLLAQVNMIYYNPDFVTDVNYYSVTGYGTLSHSQEGVETTGSALIVVDSATSSINGTRLNSQRMNLPDSVKGNLLFFSFYAKADSSAEARVRFNIYDSEGSTTVTTSSYLKLTQDFKKYSIPVHSKLNSTEFGFNIQIGKYATSYYLDDFSLVSSPTSADQINKFEDDLWKPRFFVEPDSLVITSLQNGTANITVSINNDSILGKVLSTQFGVNANFRSGDGIVDRSQLYKQFGSFRYPAGSGSNIYFWDGNIPDSFAIDFNAYSGYYWKFTDPDHFVTFKNNAGGEPTVVVNYFYARYGLTPEGTREARVQQAADYAASWVHYMNIEKGANIKFWEIGNECYGPWETGYDVNGSIVTGKEYGEDLCVFAQAMKAVDSTIKIGAVLSHSDYEWNNQVMAEVGEAADFLIVHHYFNVYDKTSSVSSVNEMTWDMQELQASAYHYSGKSKGYFPVAFTEFNIQGKPTTSMMNGLFVADALGNMVKSGFFMSTIWVNEWNVSDYETHGILTKNDPYQEKFTPRPSYTPFYYYGKCFGDLMVDATVSGSDEVRIYASTFASGEAGIVLLNYSPTPQNIKIQFADSSKIDSLFWYSVYADTIKDSVTKFYVNGLTSSTVGGGPENLDTVFAFAAKYDDNKVFTLNKNSVTYIVAKKKYSSSPTGSWQGNFSNDWSTAYNWADKRVPDSTTDVIIPAPQKSSRS